MGSLNEALLELTTPQKRKIFRVDGEPYEFRDRDELTLLQLHQIRTALPKLQKAVSNEEDARSNEKTLNEFLQVIVVSIDPLLPRLGYVQKVAVLESFLGLLLGNPTPATSRVKREKKRT